MHTELLATVPTANDPKLPVKVVVCLFSARWRVIMARVVDAGVDTAALECIHILQNACDVLKARLKWAQNLGVHSHVDTGVLRAYSTTEDTDESPFGAVTVLKTAAVMIGKKIRKHPTLSILGCVAIGALTAGWFVRSVWLSILGRCPCVSRMSCGPRQIVWCAVI
jgi:hypothetical protein